jgi:DNA-binding NarL/FixJ family response regulator
MSDLPDEATILIVDSLPLRNFGLVALLDHLSGATKYRLAALAPEDAERWIDGHANCSMIIYNVGGASVADHKHLKRIKGLRSRAAEAPLVILSDNDSREEISSALSAGAQGFLYAGTNAQLALQALSFIFKGGSYFPAAVPPRRRLPVQANGTMVSSSPVASILDEGDGAVESAATAGSINFNLTDRQKSVLERLGRGDSNKTIARLLGIREGTVKVHVRQIMRKLGVVNRTQVAIACANGAAAEIHADDGGIKSKLDSASSSVRFGVALADSMPELVSLRRS